jgi:hypothetical protein
LCEPDGDLYRNTCGNVDLYEDIDGDTDRYGHSNGNGDLHRNTGLRHDGELHGPRSSDNR